jgi:ribosome maturation factor RimP
MEIKDFIDHIGEKINVGIFDKSSKNISNHSGILDAIEDDSIILVNEKEAMVISLNHIKNFTIEDKK